MSQGERRSVAGRYAECWLHRLLPLVRAIVPESKRGDWVREWQAELWHLGHSGSGFRDRRIEASEALSLAYGLIADAAWLRWDWLRATGKGSAPACLTVLSAWCLLLAAVELAVAGSMHAFLRVFETHFIGLFVFVAAPAIVAAVSTYPLRPLRCDGGHARTGRLLSTRARWNLFLGVKVGLTLLLGFLASMVATVPVRMAVGVWSGWFELLMFSVVVTVGLRWALLNQEQRCQKCLRMLSQPTRVGPPSRNFLDWNGTEQACADGHGLLQVPEMQGSWCWYDLWVEPDSEWSGLFSS